jgi:AraC-like DNA-binding protein
MTKTFSADEVLRVPEHAALQPLVDQLSQQLRRAGVGIARAEPRGVQEFAGWYLDVVQALEHVIAHSDDRPPMTRREVELMCRCAVTGAHLGDAMELVVDYCAMLYPRAGLMNLKTQGDLTVFSMDSLRSQTTSMSRVVDITGLHAFYQLFSWLVGRRITLQGVSFSRSSREELLPFLILFDAPALAQGQGYGLCMDSELLTAPIVRTRSELSSFLREYPCRIFGTTAHLNVSQQVSALLGAAAGQDSVIPTLTQIAGVLGVSEITLRRRLKNEKTSYRKLRDACLVEAAQHHLLRGEIGIDDLAEILGFSDATAFRRSFKRCTGLSPSNWKAASIENG